MVAYQTILIATDLSAASDQLVTRGLRLAPSAQHLHLVHVLQHPDIMYAAGEFVTPLETDIELELIANAQAALCTQARRFDLPNHHTHFIEGKLQKEVVALAHSLAVELIIVGGHDRHGLDLLLGSTADGILHALPCDVLTVKIPAGD